MRLRHKLSALLALAAAAPVGVAGWSALAIAERGAIRVAEESERREARAAAARLSGELGRIRDLLRLFARRSFAFQELDERDLLGAERLIYGLDERITVTSILREDGSGAAPSYYRRAGEMGARPVVSQGALIDHAAHVPLADAFLTGEAVGAVYRNRDGAVRLALVALSDPDTDADADADHRRAALVAEVALDDLLAQACPGATLYDADGRVIAGPLRRGAGNPVAPAIWRGGESARVGDQLYSFASLSSYPIGVAVARPLRAILEPARDLRRRIAFWALVGAAAALCAGLAFAGGLTRPLDELAAAAQALGHGDLDRRVTIEGRDELALLGGSFNAMADRLRDSRAEMERWNRELEGMVKERTAELRDAIEQLLLAHRLAAIGQLGAGVAHEINNPLTSLLGALRLLATAPAETRERMLSLCVQSAERIQAVVAGLLQVTSIGDDGRRAAVDVNALVEGTLRMVAGGLAERRIAVVLELCPSLPRIHADPSALTQAVVQIVNNARDAMPEGGTLTVSTAATQGEKLVLVRLADTGRGIPKEHLDRLFDPFFTTRAQSGHKGLGLSLAYRAVKDQGGTILAESAPAGGTRITLRMPALPRSLSLS